MHFIEYDVLFQISEKKLMEAGKNSSPFATKIDQKIIFSFQNIVSKPLTGIDWKRYPKELCPSTSDKKSTKRQKSTPKPRVPTKKSKVENPDDLLDKLEKAEKNDKGNEGSDAEGSDNDDDDNESTKNEEIEEDEPDEEMDDGTDYANNYFDNGDGYLDEEEDNIDEGGIY